MVAGTIRVILARKYLYGVMWHTSLHPIFRDILSPMMKILWKPALRPVPEPPSAQVRQKISPWNFAVVLLIGRTSPVFKLSMALKSSMMDPCSSWEVSPSSILTAEPCGNCTSSPANCKPKNNYQTTVSTSSSSSGSFIMSHSDTYSTTWVVKFCQGKQAAATAAQG